MYKKKTTILVSMALLAIIFISVWMLLANNKENLQSDGFGSQDPLSRTQEEGSKRILDFLEELNTTVQELIDEGAGPKEIQELIAEKAEEYVAELPKQDEALKMVEENV